MRLPLMATLMPHCCPAPDAEPKRLSNAQDEFGEDQFTAAASQIQGVPWPPFMTEALTQSATVFAGVMKWM